MMEVSAIFYLTLLLISFLFASVGHGGASGYIALMTLFSFAPEEIRPAALVMNIFVSGIAFYHFYRAGHFRKDVFFPLAVVSIPAAFIGGMIQVDAGVYKIILGVILCIPVFTLLGLLKINRKEVHNKISVVGLVFTGLCIGFFSGLIGIGGGIILSPLLLLLAWTNMKETAAVSALFIFVNSIAGILGQKVMGLNLNVNLISMVGLVILGGFVGAFFGAGKWSKFVLEKVLAFVLVIAIYKLIFAG